MSDKVIPSLPLPQRPTSNDRVAWPGYWQALGYPWRTEPEIGVGRQKELTKQLQKILPEMERIERGEYPFKDMCLSRADVEWLIAVHEEKAANLNDRQKNLVGLDLRGADLRGIDLRNLPLARMRGGLGPQEWFQATRVQREKAAVHLEKAFLWEAHLEGAHLGRAYLDGAELKGAYLQGAFLRRASMERAYLHQAHLEGTILVGAHLEEAFLRDAHLEGQGPSPEHPEKERLPPAVLRQVFFNAATTLEGAKLGDHLYGYVRLADVRWNGANLALVDWGSIKELGDEREARKNEKEGQIEAEVLDGYREAVRAYRQLAIALREQGLNEEANRFLYRGQVIQRKVLWRQRKFLQVLGSFVLDVLAGYGYRPGRSLIIYFGVIATFTTLYYVLGWLVGPHLSLLGSLVFSVTSFHGRGFFPGGSPGHSITLDDPLTVVAAGEAMVGLLIEITFIATFTQRFFGK